MSKMTTDGVTKLKPVTDHDGAYADLEKTVAATVLNLTGPLFTTDAADLFEAFLSGLPARDRKHYDCHCCRRFVERYGGLVTLTPEGFISSALWRTDVPAYFAWSVALMLGRVETAKVTGVFVNDAAVWGTPVTGIWTHLSGTPTLPVHVDAIKSAGQLTAEKLQDFITLKRGLSDYSVDVVREAVRVLSADALDRSEKTLGVAKWLLALHESLTLLKGHRRDNVIWRAVATAPAGWCHVRSTMISTLMDDIKAGLGFDIVSRRWGQKMHPLQYQRPTAPPAAGTVKQANEVLTKLEAAGAMARRFARLEEVASYWRPKEVAAKPESPKGGFFDHLLPGQADASRLELPATKMTWLRFKDVVLPNAKTLEVLAPSRGSYFGMTTAVNPDAPPILRWDREPRNPVSWFFFHGGSSASLWGLTGNAWVKVNAVCHKPSHWYGDSPQDAPAAFLILEGCKLQLDQPGGLFFPEQLRSEFHGIRSVMEAHSNRTALSGRLEGTANGFAVQKHAEPNLKIRVNGSEQYLIDRWE